MPLNEFPAVRQVVKRHRAALLASDTDMRPCMLLSAAMAQVFAAERQMEERYGAAQAASDEWRRRAEWALRKGDEDLAREALRRRKTFEVRCMIPAKSLPPHSCLL